MKSTIIHAEAMAWLKDQPANSFDAFFADPPYGLSPDGVARDWDQISRLRHRENFGREEYAPEKGRGFMNKKWDAGVPGPSFWREVLRVLKPGAPVLAFGGSRTYHRMVCAIEDAGFRVVDKIAWIYGQGMPKSHNISKSIDKKLGVKRKVVGTRTLVGSAALSLKEKGGTYASGTSSQGRTVDIDVTEAVRDEARAWGGHGTALRPSIEDIVLAHKPWDGTIAESCMKWGTGGVWVDGCRLEGQEYTQEEWSAKGAVGTPSPVYGKHKLSATDLPPGRWPPNVVLDEEAAAMMDEQSGNRPGMSGGGKHKAAYAGGMFGGIDCEHTARADNGGASRFFYIAKVSKWERDFGCDALPLRSPAETVERVDGSAGIDHARVGAGRSGAGVRNHHPTLKPIALTEWAAKLILPPTRGIGCEFGPRRLLNIFGGSGSEHIGAIRAGWDEVVSVEREDEYIPILQARIAKWATIPNDLPVDKVRGNEPDPRQVTIEDILRGLE